MNEHSDIFIDKHGMWYIHGEEMTRKDIVQYFYRYLKKDSNGNYLLEIDNEHHYVEVEDVPYIIERVDASFSRNDGQPCIEIALSDGNIEELDLSVPLWTGKGNVMYGRVKRRQYVARFSRPAYYQLCELLEYDSIRGNYAIAINNHSYPLTIIT
jgi:uncharacterized protein